MELLRWNRTFVLAGTILAAAGALSPARAQDSDDLKRGVARISYMDGQVSVRRGDSGEWVAGVVNAPLLADDRISTGPNSRAEIQFDAANALRIGGTAEVRLTQLEYGRYQMEIARGTVTYRVLRPSTSNVEVDTPSVSVRPSKEGAYRISVNEAGESDVTARAGEVEVFTPSGSQWVYTGQAMRARGSAADPEFQILNAAPRDDWDRWNDGRDRPVLQSQSYQYVGQGVYGVEDMDSYGSWSYVAPYGYCWRPTVVVNDWAPYRHGRWVWEDWYGWTWVSYDPWGWAPYHYGRWFQDASFGWCWYPGNRGYRHHWSPALVAFFGWGGGGGFGFGFGNVGWLPLAPYEVFRPWWGRGYDGRSGYLNRSFNVTNVNIANAYRNGRGNGISGMNAGDFRAGQFRNVTRVSGDQVRQVGLVRGRVPMSPERGSLSFSDRQAGYVPRTNESTRFFTHQQPNGVQRVPFGQQQRSFEQAGRATESVNHGTVGSRSTANSGGERALQSGLRQSGASTQGQGGGGWRRFSESQGQSSSPRVSEGQGTRNTRPSEAPNVNQTPAQRGGWQRFGEAGANQAAPRSTAPQTAPQSNRGWNRFGDPGSSNSAPQYRSSPTPRSEYRGSASPAYSAPSYSAPRSSSGGGATAPRSSGGGGGRPSGGGSSSGGSRGGHR